MEGMTEVVESILIEEEIENVESIVEHTIAVEVEMKVRKLSGI
jgi:hypothetical protein